MDMLVVVPELVGRQLPHGLLRRLVPLAEDGEADLAARVSGDRRVGVLGVLEHLLGLNHQALDDVHVQPQAFGLRGGDTAGAKGLLDGLVEGLLEEELGGTDGIRGVDDDDIELALALVHELDAITDVNGHAGIVVADRGGGQVLLGRLDHYLVNLADGDLLHRIVLGDLTEDTTVTTTDHHDLYRTITSRIVSSLIVFFTVTHVFKK